MIPTLHDFGLRFASVAKNRMLHSKTKHIDVRYHFLRDHHEKVDIDLCRVDTENQLADIFTKTLDQAKLVRLFSTLSWFHVPFLYHIVYFVCLYFVLYM